MTIKQFYTSADRDHDGTKFRMMMSSILRTRRIASDEHASHKVSPRRRTP